MNISPLVLWRGFGAVVGFTVAVWGIYWALYGGMYTFAIFEALVPQGEPGENTNTGEQAISFLLWQFRWVFFPAIGLSIAALFWDPNYRWRDRVVATTLFIITFPAFFLNIIFHDHLIRLSAQACLDIVVAVCSLYFLTVLLQQRVESILFNIVRYIAIISIGVFLVLVPLLYAAIWALERFGLRLDGRLAFSSENIPFLLAIAGFLGALATYGYKLRLSHYETLVKSAVPTDRLAAIQQILGTYYVKTDDMASSEKAQVIAQQLHLKGQRQQLYFMAFLAAMILGIGLFLNSIRW